MRPWNDADYIVFDFETSGVLPEYALQPWRIPKREAWATSLVSLEIADGKKIFAGGVVHSDEIPEDEGRILVRRYIQDMLTKALDEKKTLVGWNLLFDIQVLLAYGFEDLVFKSRFLDGMLLWRHAEIEPEYDLDRSKKRSYGLKAFVEEHLPEHAGYETEIDFHDTSVEARAKLHTYNKKDNVFTFVGARHWYNSLESHQLRAALIEAESLPMVARANLHGMPTDTLVCNELSLRLQRDAATEAAKLAEHGVDETVVRSPLKLAKVIFDDWGLPVLKENKGKKTGKISRATDKEVLHELAFLDPRAKSLRLYREALNNRTKFAEAPIVSTLYCGDGATHPQARIFGTYTSRMTYSSKQGKNKDERPIGFALHQEKNDKLFRAILVTPPGYGLLEFDAAGQEYRWMAIASGDPTMLSLCEPGEDPHSYMGARIINVDYHRMIELKETDNEMKAGRKLGKVANLSLQYRTSAKKLRVVARVQYDIPMEMPEANRTHFTYQRTYPGVPKYWTRQIAETKRLGYVETFAGRRVQVIGDWAGSFGWSMGSTAINYRIQGTGADQKYLAMACIKGYLAEIGGYFAWDLHDGLYFYVPIRKVLDAAVQIKHILDNLPYKRAWGFTPPIPLMWDSKISFSSWGDLVDAEKYLSGDRKVPV